MYRQPHYETEDEVEMIKRTLCLLRLHKTKIRGDDGNVYYECERCTHRWVQIYDKILPLRQGWLDGGKWAKDKKKKRKT
jgi:hypothetical protein